MRAGGRWLTIALLTCCACSNDDDGPIEPAPGEATRTWRMGFSAIPPHFNPDEAKATIDLWSLRGDAAILHVSPPWAALLSGANPVAAVTGNELPLATYYRSRNLEVVVMVDATDGLNRGAEAPELVQLGRSISEPAVQQVYRQFVLAVASIVRPEYL